MRFWAELLPMLPGNRYKGGGNAPDLDYAHVRDAIRISDIQRENPDWLRFLNLEGCINVNTHDPDAEKKITKMQEVMMSVDLFENLPHPTGRQGGGVIDETRKHLLEELNKHILGERA